MYWELKDCWQEEQRVAEDELTCSSRSASESLAERGRLGGYLGRAVRLGV